MTEQQAQQERSFQPYIKSNSAGSVLNTPTSPSFTKLLGPFLVETYREINPVFTYSSSLNPRRLLTIPGESLDPANPYDNLEHNFIIHVNDEIVGPRRRYLVLDSLGTGSFGQVVKCMEKGTKQLVALKVIKNLPVYHNQGLVELGILETLNEAYDPDHYPMVRLLDHFVFRNHLCFVFELLGVSLFDLIKMNRFQGISLNLVRIFAQQILVALDALSHLGIIHCDLKPENILLEDGVTPAIKVIDFGSACYENQTVYSYIQSRFYRAPEVLLGLNYSSPIDIWSLGCLTFELFGGLPLFPGQNQHRMLMRIEKAVGPPPSYMLDAAEHTQKYYNWVNGQWELKTDERYMIEQQLTAIPPYRQYFKGDSFEAIINNYPFKPGISQTDREAEQTERKALVHLLKCMIRWEPDLRWTPSLLLQHPFIKGEPLTDAFLEQTTDARLGFTRRSSYSRNTVVTTYSNSKPVGSQDGGAGRPSRGSRGRRRDRNSDETLSPGYGSPNNNSSGSLLSPRKKQMKPSPGTSPRSEAPRQPNLRPLSQRRSFEMRTEPPPKTTTHPYLFNTGAQGYNSASYYETSKSSGSPYPKRRHSENPSWYRHGNGPGHMQHQGGHGAQALGHGAQPFTHGGFGNHPNPPFGHPTSLHPPHQAPHSNPLNTSRGGGTQAHQTPHSNPLNTSRGGSHNISLNTSHPQLGTSFGSQSPLTSSLGSPRSQQSLSQLPSSPRGHGASLSQSPHSPLNRSSHSPMDYDNDFNPNLDLNFTRNQGEVQDKRSPKQSPRKKSALNNQPPVQAQGGYPVPNGLHRQPTLHSSGHHPIPPQIGPTTTPYQAQSPSSHHFGTQGGLTSSAGYQSQSSSHAPPPFQFTSPPAHFTTPPQPVPITYTPQIDPPPNTNNGSHTNHGQRPRQPPPPSTPNNQQQPNIPTNNQNYNFSTRPPRGGNNPSNPVSINGSANRYVQKRQPELGPSTL